MNGPDHYEMAERLLIKGMTNEQLDPETASDLLVAAQIHATLALAAATADRGGPDDEGWRIATR